MQKVVRRWLCHLQQARVSRNGADLNAFDCREFSSKGMFQNLPATRPTIVAAPIRHLSAATHTHTAHISARDGDGDGDRTGVTDSLEVWKHQHRCAAAIITQAELTSLIHPSVLHREHEECPRAARVGDGNNLQPCP